MMGVQFSRVNTNVPDEKGEIGMAEKKAEKAEKVEDAGGKKKPPLMIIMAVVAVVVLGAAFVVVQKASAKQKGAAVKKIVKGPVMTMDEFLVNLSDPGNDHFLKVTVGLELDKSKGKTAESLKEDTPLIRDAVLSSLSSKTRDQIAPESGREKLKAEIKKKVNEALGEDDVQGIYFTNFVMQ
jgi:flagellar FliL protein